VTDDFSLAYFLAKSIVKHNGKLDADVVKEALINWSNTDEYFIPFAGPTTRAAIERLKGIEVQKKDEIVNYNATATNGSAMKIFPVGLLNAGNIEQAIKDAALVSVPTHNNHLSISGACALAAAVSKAMDDDADVYSIVQAGLYGRRNRQADQPHSCGALCHKEDGACNRNCLEEQLNRGCHAEYCRLRGQRLAHF